LRPSLRPSSHMLSFSPSLSSSVLSNVASNPYVGSKFLTDNQNAFIIGAVAIVVFVLLGVPFYVYLKFYKCCSCKLDKDADRRVTHTYQRKSGPTRGHNPMYDGYYYDGTAVNAARLMLEA
jgi:hypothetical protein